MRGEFSEALNCIKNYNELDTHDNINDKAYAYTSFW